jgi:hypothetical protein
MSQQQHIAFKKRLHQHCIAIIEQRIATTLVAMNNAQAAANNEEKSSAGDKYETGRAMGHLEKDMHASQLAANRKELAALLTVDCNTAHSTVTTGSFIDCSNVHFFIAAGLGKISFEEKIIFLLSPAAPMAMALRNKKAGDSIVFNNKPLLIETVY